MNFVTYSFWTESEIVIDYNFGMVNIKPEGVDFVIEMKSINLEGNLLLEKRLSLKKDLQYSEEDRRYGRMCTAAHAKHKFIMQMMQSLS